MFIAFLAAILIGLVPAFIAQSKGRSFMLWWLYGAAIFIAALPHALLIKPLARIAEANALADGGRKCPFCAEVVKAEAKVCRYCQRDLPPIEIDDPEGRELGDLSEEQLMKLYSIEKDGNQYAVITYEGFFSIEKRTHFPSLREAIKTSFGVDIAAPD